jgi:hypothetical protein
VSVGIRKSVDECGLGVHNLDGEIHMLDVVSVSHAGIGVDNERREFALQILRETSVIELNVVVKLLALSHNNQSFFVLRRKRGG